MGNVYRNINILIENGLIQASEFGDGIVHYDAIVSIHYHFICKERVKPHIFASQLGR